MLSLRNLCTAQSQRDLIYALFYKLTFSFHIKCDPLWFEFLYNRQKRSRSLLCGNGAVSAHTALITSTSSVINWSLITQSRSSLSVPFGLYISFTLIFLDISVKEASTMFVDYHYCFDTCSKLSIDECKTHFSKVYSLYFLSKSSLLP